MWIIILVEKAISIKITRQSEKNVSSIIIKEYTYMLGLLKTFIIKAKVSSKLYKIK